MSIDDDIATLEKVPMLNVLGRAALRLIAIAAETRQVETGEILFGPTDRPDCAFVIQQGAFAIGVDPYAGTAKSMDAGPGAMLGEFALMTDAARPLSATALEPSTVIRISRSMFMRILEDDGHAAVRLRDYIDRRATQSVADMTRVRDLLVPPRQ